MKLQTKKSIAREFLVLILAVIIALVSFLLIYPYNSFRQHQLDNLSDTIYTNAKLVDSLVKPYNIKKDKQLWFTDKYINKYADLPQSREKANQKIWNSFHDWSEKDSIIYMWKNVWGKEFISFLKEIGFETSTDFQKFIKENIITSTDTERKSQADKIDTEINLLKIQKTHIQSKLFSSKNQNCFALNVFLVCILGLFGVRYVYYGVKWSLKVLRQKEQ